VKVSKSLVLKIEMEEDEAAVAKKIAAATGETVQQAIQKAVKNFLSKGVQTIACNQ